MTLRQWVKLNRQVIDDYIRGQYCPDVAELYTVTDRQRYTVACHAPYLRALAEAQVEEIRYNQV